MRRIGVAVRISLFLTPQTLRSPCLHEAPETAVILNYYFFNYFFLAAMDS